MICEFKDLGAILIRNFKSPFSDVRALGDYKFNPSPSITFDPREERIEWSAGLEFVTTTKIFLGADGIVLVQDDGSQSWENIDLICLRFLAIGVVGGDNLKGM